MESRPLDEVAAQHVHVGITTEAGTVWHGHLAVLRHHEVVQRAGLQIDEQPLERRVGGDGRVDMQRGQEAGAEIGVVRHHAHAERLGQRGDLQHRRGAADLDDAGLGDVDRAGLELGVEVVQAGGVLARGDRHAALAADTRQAGVIAGRGDRFLQPGQIELAHAARHVDRLPRRSRGSWCRPSGVHPDRSPGARRGPRGR